MQRRFPMSQMEGRWVEGAQDKIAQKGNHTLFIAHNDLRGKGFMPQIKDNGGGVSFSNGGMHYGTDDRAYREAVKEGWRMLDLRNSK